jgi:hypothetical protein
MSSLKSLEVRNILESIEKASGRESETEWERIADSLQQCDDEILKLRQENKIMRECLEIIKEDKYEATPWLTVETGSAKRAKECLAKLTKDGK